MRQERRDKNLCVAVAADATGAPESKRAKCSSSFRQIPRGGAAAGAGFVPLDNKYGPRRYLVVITSGAAIEIPS